MADKGRDYQQVLKNLGNPEALASKTHATVTATASSVAGGVGPSAGALRIVLAAAVTHAEAATPFVRIVHRLTGPLDTPLVVDNAMAQNSFLALDRKIVLANGEDIVGVSNLSLTNFKIDVLYVEITIPEVIWLP